MSTRIMSDCWPLQGFSPAQKAVLISLADNANDEGVCWPSVTTIAERTCLSERAVQRAIKHLISEKILCAEGRKGRSNWYTISVQDFLESKAQQNLLEEVLPPSESHPRQKVTPDTVTPHPRHSDTPPPSESHHTPVTVTPITVIEPSKEPSENRQSYSAEFEQFWQKYPKRAGDNPKKPAWTIWLKNLKQGISANQMIHAAEIYCRYCILNNKIRSEFVKQAKTFLNSDECLANPDEVFPLTARISPQEQKQRQRQEIRDAARNIADTDW